MKILIANTKGGVGKTTVTTNLAGMLALSGRDVLVVDTDLQSSASLWSAKRDELSIEPRVPTIQKFGSTALHKEIEELAPRFDDVVIDAGGRDSSEIRFSLVVADVLYIPTMASQLDLWSFSAFNQMIVEARHFNPDLEVRVLLNRVPTHPFEKEADDARAFFTDEYDFSLSNILLRERIAYRKAITQGLTVQELAPVDYRARQEYLLLFKEVTGNDFFAAAKTKAV